MPRVAPKPVILTLAEAASLLKVSEKTVRRWIDKDSIPYLALPGGHYRIPQGALLASLGHNFDLAGELREIDEWSSGLTEDDIAAAL